MIFSTPHVGPVLTHITLLPVTCQSHSKALTSVTFTTLISVSTSTGTTINNIRLLKVLIKNFIIFNDFIRFWSVINVLLALFHLLTANNTENKTFLSFNVFFTLKMLRSEILINNETLTLNFLNFIEIDVINTTLYGLFYYIIKIFI